MLPGYETRRPVLPVKGISCATYFSSCIRHQIHFVYFEYVDLQVSTIDSVFSSSSTLLLPISPLPQLQLLLLKTSSLEDQFIILFKSSEVNISSLIVDFHYLLDEPGGSSILNQQLKKKK